MTHTILKVLLGVTTIMTTQSSLAADTPALSTKMINPESLFDPAPLGFSHVVVAKVAAKIAAETTAKGAHHIAYIAGQGGEKADGGLDNDFGAQFCSCKSKR